MAASTKRWNGRIRVALLSILLWTAGSQPALALTNYTDVIGANFSFTSILEQTFTGDTEPLFDQPVGLFDQLLFSPTTFSASSSGGAPLDQTGSLLQVVITSTNPQATIEEVLIDEAGTATLSGSGTAATGTFASMSGDLTVTETTGGPIAPVVIPFTGIMTPTDALFGLPGDVGANLWSGSVSIDVASVVANATKATLAFNDLLIAASETGTDATILKDEVTVKVTPEPGTFALLGAGLFGLAARARRRVRQKRY